MIPDLFKTFTVTVTPQSVLWKYNLVNVFKHFLQAKRLLKEQKVETDLLEGEEFKDEKKVSIPLCTEMSVDVYNTVNQKFLRGFYFRETSQMQSFVKIKPL